ncbi:MAG: M17 family metallopeptidase [Kordiimonas sp.]
MAPISLELVVTSDMEKRPENEAKWAEANSFKAKPGTFCVVPSTEGEADKILLGVGDNMPSASDPWWLAAAQEKLASGIYEVINAPDDATLAAGAYGWAAASYKFDKYLSESIDEKKVLVLPASIDRDSVVREAEATALVRDLVNTPTDDLGPAELQDAAEALAEEFGGSCSTIVGEDLLDENFPAIHAVGRAAANGREPRLIDLSWGDDSQPTVTLVGKGVCFDTGGLDIKTGGYMRLMKKDMGGAANALGLARLIMANDLKVKLRVLIPAVENAIAGDAYRPGDVIATRKGLSVEVGNTDAEGRIVLCDAITLACEEKPDLLMDFATLTGAARVALGPDLPATYTNDDGVWSALEAGGKLVGDPLWRMPLWAPYDDNISSAIADVCNISDTPMGGSITAALYLQRFVEEDIKWVHVDLFAWNPKARAGRPKGGEAQAIRAAYNALDPILSLDE